MVSSVREHHDGPMTAGSERVATLVVDDHIMLAEGVAAYLRQADDIEVIGVTATGQQTMESLAERAADVVLLDFRLPDTAGDELATQILERWPQTRILMITANDDAEVIVRAISAGCHGFLPKGRSASDLLAAVRAVHAGEAVFDPTSLARALPQMRHQRRDRAVGDDLTPREREILQFLAEGVTTTGIAGRLVLSQATVRNHVQNILTKLDAHSKLEAVTIALRHGLATSR